MLIKAVEIRDKATFIPAIAVQMVPASENERYLMRRCGYGFEFPSVILARMNGDGKAHSDPYSWGDRTMKVAHIWIDQNFDTMTDGHVVDVEHILGENPTLKQSERETEPL